MGEERDGAAGAFGVGGLMDLFFGRVDRERANAPEFRAGLLRARRRRLARLYQMRGPTANIVSDLLATLAGAIAAGEDLGPFVAGALGEPDEAEWAAARSRGPDASARLVDGLLDGREGDDGDGDDGPLA
jgi:hypothetical protein